MVVPWVYIRIGLIEAIPYVVMVIIGIMCLLWWLRGRRS